MKQSLIVCNLRYEKLCDLLSNSDYSARRIKETLRLNQITQLSFDVPLKNPNLSYIINENLILFNGEYYRIKTPVITHTEDGKSFISVSCSHLSETLQSNVVTLDEIKPVTVVELMKIALVYNGNSPTLGWKVGNISVNINKKRGLERSEQSSFSHLCIIAEKYDGILIFNSQSRTVDMIPRIDIAKPDFELSVYKNLKNIDITYDTSEMVTRLYCFGGNDKNGNEINIMSVNPTGKAYVENYNYFLGLGYTQADINAKPELFIKTNIWRDTNYYLPSDLYNDGIKELEKVAKPKIDIKVEALNLEQFPEYRMVPLSLGEAINVRDEDLGISFICNVIGRTIDYDQPHILNIELTNQIDYKNLLSELFTKVSTASQVITSGGIINGAAIDGINTTQIRDLSAKYASIEYLIANYIDALSIASQYAKINELEANYATFDYLTVNYATIDNLITNYITAREIATNYLKTVDADIKYATIQQLITNYLDATEINTYFLKVEDADIKYATIERLITDYLDATTISSTYLKTEDANIKFATIEYLTNNYLTANNANITYAKIVDLEAVNTHVNSLSADVGVINTLLSGTAVSGSTQTINLTAENTTIENALIKDAMIDNISANKVNAGVVNTNKVSIESESGRMIIADNTIQIKDGTRVRVQIGKDASNDYNMYVWDVNGKLMFDATGIKEDAIKSAIIRDDMVSPTANINASKIDIGSLFEVINDDNTHTLKGSKILLDGENQTLDILFTSLTTNLENIQDIAESKKRIFTTTPAPPYEVNDLWINSSGELLKCIKARENIADMNETHYSLTPYKHQHLSLFTHDQIRYSSHLITDWERATKYTDDSTANKALLETRSNTTQLNVTNGKIDSIISENDIISIEGEGTTFYDKYLSTKQTVDQFELALVNNETNLNNLISEVKTNSAKISATPENIKSVVNSNYISGQIEIGGRNLLFNTDQSFIAALNGNGSVLMSGELLKSFTRNNAGLLLKKGQTYTLHFNYSIENYVIGSSFGLGTGLSVGTYDQDTFVINNSYAKFGGAKGRVIYTFTYNSDDVRYLAFSPIKIDSGNSGTMIITISNLKVEIGNVATDWSPAPEDVVGQINGAVGNVTASYQTAISQTAQSILVTLNSSLSMMDDKIIESINTEIEALTGRLNLSFSEVTSLIENNIRQISEVNQNFTFSATGLEIGKVGSRMKLVASNDRLSFMDGNNETAYINGNKMYITDLDVVNSLEVGNHKIEQYNNEITLIRFIG